MPPRRAALASLLAVLGCGHAPPSLPVPAASPAPVEYRYRVAATAGAAELSVEVELPPGGAVAQTWVADPTLQPFVHDLVAGSAGALRAVPASAKGWAVPACAGAPCQLRYRVLLGEAARALHDFNGALAQPGGMLAPPSAWLLRPELVHAPFALAVTASPGESFVSGLALAEPGGRTYRGDVGALDDTPYAAFGRFTVARHRVEGGDIDVAFLGGAPTPAIERWVDSALGALAAYYGRFPIEHAALVVRVSPGSGVDGGHTMGNGGGSVLISVGEGSSAAVLADDWILVHELVHVSFPDVARPWLEEGLATYLEPVIRIRSGLCDADELWRSLLEGLPKGQPEGGDGGLDVTDTWGRRYWGGALFWFLADVEIRTRTGGARSLDDALRAVNRGGGNVGKRWDADRVLAMGDAGAGVPVLVPLRKRLGSAAVRVDLDAVWRRLGVSLQGGRVVYDDAAALASIRLGIMGRGVGGPGGGAPPR